MRRVTQEGLNLIMRFEGLRLEPYDDAAGLPTIGYGHLIRPGEAFGEEITEEEAEALLRNDLGVAERAVLRLIHVPLTDRQFDALASFTFNLGSGALQRSTLRQKVNHEEHAEVPPEFKRWVWAGGRKLNGLVRRRAAEAQRYQVQE